MNRNTVPLNGNDAKSRGYLFRLLDVLEQVVDASEPITLSMLAERADVPMSTASRLTTLLVDRGYIHRLDRGAFTTGPQLLHLGLRAISRLGSTHRLEQVTSELGVRFAESVSAGMLVGNRIVLVARHEPAHPLRIVARVGDVIHPSNSALGKAIMANLSHERRLAVLAQADGGNAPESSGNSLQLELDKVVSDGYAIDEETFAIGQRCRAVPLFDHNGQAYGGLSVAGPTARFSQEDADGCILLLTETARRLSLTSPHAPEALA